MQLERRIEKLEALAPDDSGIPEAVVRYTPPTGTTGWLPDMLARIGWPAGRLALMTIDANGEPGGAPELTVPPVPYDRLTSAQQHTIATAGTRPGNWYVAVTGRGVTDPTPMFDGSAALIAELRAMKRRHLEGHGVEL